VFTLVERLIPGKYIQTTVEQVPCRCMPMILFFTNQSMLDSRKRVKPSLQLVARGVQVEQVWNFRYLGVWFSDDLGWSAHVASVCVHFPHFWTGR